MGIFSGIEEANYNEGGVWFLPGNYVVLIDKVKKGETRKGVDFFVVETTIRWSDNPERRAGSGCSWMCTSDKDAFLGNVKKFCEVATNYEADITEAGVEMLCSEQNPLKGLLLRVQATNIKTKAGNDFTKCIWKQLSPEEEKKFGQAT